MATAIANRRRPWSLRLAGDCLDYWRTLCLILAPILLLPLPLISRTSEGNCAYVVLLMAVYWVTEAAPLPVTAFLPVALFPVLGIASAANTCMQYLKDTNFIFVGGLIMAVALEDANLHKRLALRVLLWMGSEPRWLMMGFLSTTAFLSMWMSNTATAAMMMPIAIVVLEELIRYDLNQTCNERLPMSPATTTETVRQESSDEVEMNSLIRGSQSPTHDHLVVVTRNDQGLSTLAPVKSSPFITDNKWLRCDVGVQTDDRADSSIRSVAPPVDSVALHKIPDFNKLPPHLKGMCKATLLCIAYAANLGGTGTLTGTGPNLIFVGQLNQFHPNQSSVTYLSWFAFGTPSMVLCCFLGWVWLVVWFMGWRSLFHGCCRKDRNKLSSVQDALRQKYNELGPVSFAEWSVTFWLVVLILLWVFRMPLFMPGWDQWLHLKPDFSSDACASMLIGSILFVFPNEKPDFLCWRKDRSKRPKLRRSLMTWTSMQKKFPWGVIILLGGGFAMADGVKRSGLSTWVGCGLQSSLEQFPKTLTVFIFIVIITFVTEIASNSATTSIFIPVVLSVAKSLHVNPLYFGLPSTVAASYAFMLPVATPPNAIVYESRMIKVTDMVISGFVMNMLCICVTLFNINTWSYLIFDLGSDPSWIGSKNETSTGC